MVLMYIANAIQADADTCNAVEAPTAGTPTGGGIHVDIPVDWQTQVSAGNHVAGCTYSHVRLDNYLAVSEHIQTSVPPAAVIPGVPPSQLQSFKTKLASATAVPVTGGPPFATG